MLNVEYMLQGMFDPGCNASNDVAPDADVSFACYSFHVLSLAVSPDRGRFRCF